MLARVLPLIGVVAAYAALVAAIGFVFDGGTVAYYVACFIGAALLTAGLGATRARR